MMLLKLLLVSESIAALAAITMLAKEGERACQAF
jgi:hypothetical protein